MVVSRHGGGQMCCRTILVADRRWLRLAITHTHPTCVLFFPWLPTFDQRGKAGLSLFNICWCACYPVTGQGAVSAHPVPFYLLALVVVDALESWWENGANEIGVYAICGAFLGVGLQFVEDLAYYRVRFASFWIDAVIEVEENNMFLIGKCPAYACVASALVCLYSLAKC